MAGGPGPRFAVVSLNADFEARVLELVNERRRAVGQPPLKQVEELTGSSRWFARAMATQDYVAEDHNSYVRSGGDLRLACRWSTRIGYFYASWIALAEMIAAGHENGSWREMRLRSVMVEMRDGRTLATASEAIWLSPRPPT